MRGLWQVADWSGNSHGVSGGASSALATQVRTQLLRDVWRTAFGNRQTQRAARLTAKRRDRIAAFRSTLFSSSAGRTESA